jgi:hypothetical protein
MNVDFMLSQLVRPFGAASRSWNIFLEQLEELVSLLSIHYSNVGSFLHKDSNGVDVEVLRKKNAVVDERTLWDGLSTEITWRKSRKQ